MTSRHKIGDSVVINMNVAGCISGIIEAVKFLEDPHKINYDIKIFPFINEPENSHHFILLRDIDGYFVEKPEDRFKKRKSNVGLYISDN